MSKEILPELYDGLLARIGELLTTQRRQVYQTINTTLLKTYWEIGRHIVEFEQGGQKSAVYGKELLKKPAKDLTRSYGKGFSQSNVYYMRQFYLQFQIFQTPSGKLHWAHYCELMKLDDELGGLSTQIFVTRYQLYLPSRTLLEEKLRLLLEA